MVDVVGDFSAASAVYRPVVPAQIDCVELNFETNVGSVLIRVVGCKIPFDKHIAGLEHHGPESKRRFYEPRTNLMDEEKKKFKKFAIAAWQATYSLKKFTELMGNPSPEGERAWREQYARAQWPFGNNEKGFEEFVRTMPG